MVVEGTTKINHGEMRNQWITRLFSRVYKEYDGKGHKMNNNNNNSMSVVFTIQ